MPLCFGQNSVKTNCIRECGSVLYLGMAMVIWILPRVCPTKGPKACTTTKALLFRASTSSKSGLVHKLSLSMRKKNLPKFLSSRPFRIMHFQDHGNDNISTFFWGHAPRSPRVVSPPPPPLSVIEVHHEKDIIPTCSSSFQYAFYAP